MTGVLMTIVYFLIAITILVAVHEFGHFYVARLCGVKVLRFSIGFGKRLWSKTDRLGTEFAISAIPLGGYVKMVDEREGDVAEADLPYAYTQKTPGQRIAIALAGPVANIVLALVLYWLVAFVQGGYSVSPVIGEVAPGSIAAQAGLEVGQEIVALDGQPVNSQREVELYLVSRLGETGEITFTVRYPNDDLVYESRGRITDWLQYEHGPDVIEGLGITFYYPKVLLSIAQVRADSPAAEAGLEVGDTIVSIDGQTRDSGDLWSDYVGQRAGQPLDVVIAREQEGEVAQKSFRVTPQEYTDANGNTRGLMGIVWDVEQWPEDMVRRYEYGVLGSVTQAFKQTTDVVSTVLLSLKKLVLGDISTKNLSGPIGIAKVVGHSAKAGIWTFVNVLAYISVLLGVFNLLPIPVLDGGHILYALIEWVKGSPVSEKFQTLGYQAGLAMLLGVMVIAFYNDILHL